MQTLIHKPQREPIKGFCLERERENDARIINIMLTVLAGTTQQAVSLPQPGPARLKEVTISRTAGSPLDNVHWALYANDNADVDTVFRGTRIVGEQGQERTTRRDGEYGPHLQTVLRFKPNLLLAFSPIYLVFYANSLSGIDNGYGAWITLSGVSI